MSASLPLLEVLTVTLTDGSTFGPAYVFMADAGRHPTDNVFGLMLEDRTEREVWLSQIESWEIEEAEFPPHSHGSGSAWHWHRHENWTTTHKHTGKNRQTVGEPSLWDGESL